MTNTERKPKPNGRVEELENKLQAFEYLKITEVDDDADIDIQLNEMGFQLVTTDRVDLDRLAYVLDNCCSIKFYSTPEEVVESER